MARGGCNAGCEEVVQKNAGIGGGEGSEGRGRECSWLRRKGGRAIKRCPRGKGRKGRQIA